MVRLLTDLYENARFLIDLFEAVLSDAVRTPCSRPADGLLPGSGFRLG
jgi:hypothetical protein